MQVDGHRSNSDRHSIREEETTIGPDQPLRGLVVLDLTLARAGPTCARHLSDWGADVIAIQAPGASAEVIASRDGFDYQNLHRGKRAISLDLKSPLGHDAFLRLAKGADVVVENMRPAVKHRLNIAYEDLKAVNPRLVYGSHQRLWPGRPLSARAPASIRSPRASAG